MKTYLAFLFGGVILLNLLLAKVAFQPSPVLTPTKWEYRIESVPDITFPQTMDGLGADGWELVFARRATTGNLTEGDSTPIYEVIFKRPISAPNPSVDSSPTPIVSP